MTQKIFKNIFYLIIILNLLIVIYSRFFTETLGVLPRIFQVSDILIFFVELILLLFIKNKLKIFTFYLLLLFLFVVISSFLNIYNIFPPAVLSFIIFMFQPFVLFLFIINSDLKINKMKKIYKLLVYSFYIQIIVGLFQIPKAIKYSPDYLSGTFGYNSVQMLFFLCLITFTYYTLYLKNKNKLFLLIMPFILIIFFMASARMLWIFFPLLLIMIYLDHIKREINYSGLFLLLIVGYLIYSLFDIIALESGNFLRLFKEKLDIMQFGIVKGIIAVYELYVNDPKSILIGAGPGSFSSRAFLAFGLNWQSKENVAAGIINFYYKSDIAVKYILPKMGVYLGSATIANPTSSYTSYLGEIGIIGSLIFFYLYYYIYKKLKNINNTTKNSLVYSLSMGGMKGILLLVIMALFADWFAVSRVSLILWSIIAITFKYSEYEEKYFNNR